MKLYLSILFLSLSNANLFALNFLSLSIEQSMVRAEQENKLILVSFTAPWCLPCSIMKSGPYQDPSIISNVEKEFIAVTVNIDDISRAEWVQKFNVSTLPTHLILDKNEGIIARIDGVMNTSQFTEFVINKTILYDDGKGNVDLSIPSHMFFQSTSEVTNNMQGKIYLDGVLVDINQSVISPDHPSVIVDESITKNDISYPSATIQESPIKNFSPLSGLNFVIQLGAFPSMNKVMEHQKNIRHKINVVTEVLIDHSTPKLPYKLIVSTELTEISANLMLRRIKSKGVDCFIRQ